MKLYKTGGTKYHTEIKDMTLTGNKAGNVSGNGIHIDTVHCSQMHMRNLRVWYCKGHGIYINKGWQRYILNCHIQYNDGCGIYVDTLSENGTMVDHTVCERDCGAAEIYIAGGSTNVISNCYFENSDTAKGIHFHGAFSSSILNNFFNVTGNDAIYVTSRDNNVEGNRIHTSGGTAAIFMYDAFRCVVQGNTIYQTESGVMGIFLNNAVKGTIVANNAVKAYSALDAFKMHISADAKENIITGNMFDGNFTTGGAGTSPDSMIANNVITGTAAIGSNMAMEVHNNRGYNNLLTPVNLVVGASPFTYTAGCTPESVYIKGGNVSIIQKNGFTLFQDSSHTIELEPFSAVVVTYDPVPPAMRADPH